MRPIHLVTIDQARPALILTREHARHRMTKVTVAPITSTIRGLDVEVRLGRANGLDTDCVASLYNVTTVRSAQVGRLVGFLHHDAEAALAIALARAFDLSLEDLP